MAKANQYTEQQVAFLSESYADLVKNTEKGVNHNQNLQTVVDAYNAEFEATKTVTALRSKLCIMGEYVTVEAKAGATKSGAVQKVTLANDLGKMAGLSLDTAVKMNKSELQGLLEFVTGLVEKQAEGAK